MLPCEEAERVANGFSGGLEVSFAGNICEHSLA
jgi:hypothetical protein